MTVRNGKTVAETDRSRGEARQRDFITAYSSIMAGFYEQRVTCHKIRVCTSFAAGRPLTSQTAFSGQLPYKGSLVRPAAIFDHSPFGFDGMFFDYE